MKYELLIAVIDEDDLGSGHKRKKQGDIVAIRPYPWSWGRCEIDEYLVIIAEIDNDITSMKKKLHKHKGKNLEKHRYKIDMTSLKNNYCAELDMAKVENKNYIYQPFKKSSELIGTYITMDNSSEAQGYRNTLYSTCNKRITYDIYLENMQIIQNISGLSNEQIEIALKLINITLSSEDVDCGNNPEIEIEIPECNDLCFDKDDEDYIYLKDAEDNED
ncbi:MAG: hypothetical protein ACFFG0_14160 [Candidatus Thorarchaeota archaeon]